ncbi:MAG: hypothetical protein HXK70_04230 [Clostridiales bacterium]|nr:hypothetical protein [Clostridiales bacterium]
MFDDEIILENLSKTMEIEDQVLDNAEREMLKGILEGKNNINNTLDSIKNTYM